VRQKIVALFDSLSPESSLDPKQLPRELAGVEWPLQNSDE